MTHLDKAIRLDKEKFERERKSRNDRLNLLLKNKIVQLLGYPTTKEFGFENGKAIHSKLNGNLQVVHGELTQYIHSSRNNPYPKTIKRPMDLVLKE